MESPRAENGKNSPTYTSKDARLADDATRSGSLAATELLRLQNVLKVKDKEVEEVRKEVATLKATLHLKDRALHQYEHELNLLKDRQNGLDADLANVVKELAAVRVEKRKLEVQVAGLAKKGEKEHSMSMLLTQRSTGAVGSTESSAISPPSGQTGTLSADLRAAIGEKAAEGIRILENLLRSKDKQMHALQRKLENVEVYKTKCVDLENRVSDLLRQLEIERATGRTSVDVLRISDAEKAKLAADLSKARAALEVVQETAAKANAAQKVSEARCTELESELNVMTALLARTQAVANRVALAEVRAGCKDEGMVHVTRHLEEVRFMSGEILRLQERILALEKDLAVAEELKERYRRMSQPSTPKRSPLTSPLVSPSGAGTEGRSAFRPASTRIPVARSIAESTSSRPVSAPVKTGGPGKANENNTKGRAAAPTAASKAKARRGDGIPLSLTRAKSTKAVAVSAIARKQQAKNMPWGSNANSSAKLVAMASAEMEATGTSRARVGLASKISVGRVSRPVSAQATSRPQSPSAQPQSPSPDQQSPSSRPQSPSAQLQSPSARPQSPSMEPQSSFSQPPSSSFQLQSPEVSASLAEY